MRLSVAFDGDLPGDDGPMLALAPAAQPQTLTIETLAHGWIVRDDAGRQRLSVNTATPPIRFWSDLRRAVRLSFDDSYHGLSASLLGPLTGL